MSLATESQESHKIWETWPSKGNTDWLIQRWAVYKGVWPRHVERATVRPRGRSHHTSSAIACLCVRACVCVCVCVCVYVLCCVVLCYVVLASLKTTEQLTNQNDNHQILNANFKSRAMRAMIRRTMSGTATTTITESMYQSTDPGRSRKRFSQNPTSIFSNYLAWRVVCVYIYIYIYIYIHIYIIYIHIYI